MISLREGLQLSTGGVVCMVGAGGKTSLMFKLAGELSAAGDSVLTTTTTKIWMPTASQSKEVVISARMDDIFSLAQRFRKKNYHFTAAAEELTSQQKLKGYPPEFIDDLWERRLFRWILVEADGAAGRPLKAPAGHEPVIPSCTRWVIGLAGLDAAGNALNENWVFRPEIFAKLTGLGPGRRISPRAIAASLTHADGIFKGSPAAADRLLFLNKADGAGRIQAGREVVKVLRETDPDRFKRVVIGSLHKHPPVMEYYDFISGAEQI